MAARRAIFLTSGPIGEEQRRSESELWREFELARPAIFGALLDAAAHGLRAVGFAYLGRLPRMTDFALWAFDPAPARPVTWPIRPQTMLTVLTQRPPFLSRNWSESYRRGPLPSELSTATRPLPTKIQYPLSGRP